MEKEGNISAQGKLLKTLHVSDNRGIREIGFMEGKK